MHVRHACRYAQQGRNFLICFFIPLLFISCKSFSQHTGFYRTILDKIQLSKDSALVFNEPFERVNNALKLALNLISLQEYIRSNDSVIITAAEPLVYVSFPMQHKPSFKIGNRNPKFIYFDEFQSLNKKAGCFPEFNIDSIHFNKNDTYYIEYSFAPYFKVNDFAFPYKRGGNLCLYFELLISEKEGRILQCDVKDYIYEYTKQEHLAKITGYKRWDSGKCIK